MKKIIFLGLFFLTLFSSMAFASTTTEINSQAQLQSYLNGFVGTQTELKNLLSNGCNSRVSVDDFRSIMLRRGYPNATLTDTGYYEGKSFWENYTYFHCGYKATYQYYNPYYKTYKTTGYYSTWWNGKYSIDSEGGIYNIQITNGTNYTLFFLHSLFYFPILGGN